METRRSEQGCWKLQQSSLLVRETNWMETASSAVRLPLFTSPYLLGKPIEWKLRNSCTTGSCCRMSLLVRATNWMETEPVQEGWSAPSQSPYLLGKPIEWKHAPRSHRRNPKPGPYLLGKPIEWKLLPWSTGRTSLSRPYLLGKPIEWKQFGEHHLALAWYSESLLVRETNWMETFK